MAPVVSPDLRVFRQTIPQALLLPESLSIPDQKTPPNLNSELSGYKPSISLIPSVLHLCSKAMDLAFTDLTPFSVPSSPVHTYSNLICIHLHYLKKQQTNKITTEEVPTSKQIIGCVKSAFRSQGSVTVAIDCPQWPLWRLHTHSAA